MSTTGEAPSRAVGLFGSVSFTTTVSGTGVTDAVMGVADPAPLIVIFGLFLGLLVLTQVIYHALQQYRGDLIAARAGG